MIEQTALDWRYQKALGLVAGLFKDINRKVSNLPYIVHLVGVANIVNQYTDDKDAVVAALLHDVLEDISPDVFSEQDMISSFGSNVTNIVKTVTHDEGKYSKLESREKYIEQVINGSLEAVMVSGADLLHNAADMVYWYGKSPSEVSLAFGKSADIRSWFYEERYSVLEARLGGDHGLVKSIRPVLDRLAPIHSDISK